ncbi:probable S-adenosylmethionine-dependent methyltransferase At5g37990 [Abrus precatorius]|uniref:Probable S-adenosylmethionine-dependent methyltransferase At5g37990 n=1 Tax=Abrus precatorius TaxID=3816 RepID=A0A8B8MAD6_ABRPR|nr:probable S-adenosylmethionine-dependent methyltransferase At5g37990 [Abrus precatorius]
MEDESYAMKGGDGPHSYALNSTFQRNTIEASKKLIQEAIAENFNPRGYAEPSRPISIRVADLGCSTGPNTFLAMQTIVDAIELQFQSKGVAVQNPEFQVFLNDQVSNDFNTLFKNLPPNRKYFAAGVPGSFRGRLFPRETLHLVHSSSALNWLSKVPADITDIASSAWNKGRIHHTNAPKEVAHAYETQYKMDLENFLHARAQELVDNGLMLLEIPVASDVVLDSDADPGKVFELIGSCLVDMIKGGLVGEEEVDSFNFPLFYAPLRLVKETLERNGCFSIERMEVLHLKSIFTTPSVQIYISLYRAMLEGLIEKHFGEGIVDELFNRLAEKVKEFPDIMNTEKLKLAVLFVLLKSKPKSNDSY